MGKSTTSPVEIIVLNKEGNILNGHKIFVDNFNRISVAPDIGEFIASSNGIDTKFSSRIKYNYVTEDNMKRLTGKEILFHNIPQGNKDLVLGRLRDYWNTLTDETKKSIKSIEFADDSYFLREGLSGASAFTTFDKRIVFGGYSDDFEARVFNYPIFRHESAHARFLDLPIKKTIEETQRDYENEIRKIDQQFESGKISREEFSNKKIEVYNDALLAITPEFEIKWSKIARREEIINLYNSWPNKPAHGFIREYGTTNMREDIATYHEHIRNPEFFSQLINPESPQYDARYKEKLDLLFEYKFITEEEYKTILWAAGLD